MSLQKLITPLPVALAAACLIAPCEAAASSLGSGMGATSKASLQLSVSVRPRTGLTRTPTSEHAATESLCLWSTSTFKSFILTISSASKQAEASRPIEVVAESSARSCALSLQSHFLVPEDDGEPSLLLIAPQ
jgi:hypothetical protein